MRDVDTIVQAAAANAGVDLARLRCQESVRFDTAELDFLPPVLGCLDLPTSGTQDNDIMTLEGLRELSLEDMPTGARRRRVGDRGPATFWIRRWYQDDSAEARGATPCRCNFREIYHRFLRDVVLPDIADPNGILFQRDPTFRCHVAGGGSATGRRHSDSEYGHQTGELNYWLPLTHVGGSNSLYSESR